MREVDEWASNLLEKKEVCVPAGLVYSHYIAVQNILGSNAFVHINLMNCPVTQFSHNSQILLTLFF